MDTLVDFMGGGQYASAKHMENATERLFMEYDQFMLLLEHLEIME